MRTQALISDAVAQFLNLTKATALRTVCASAVAAVVLSQALTCGAATQFLNLTKAAAVHIVCVSAVAVVC